MDVSNYYITTITNAAVKIGPILAFVIAGYFIFIKLPFFFFLRNMNITKKEFDQKLPQDFQKDYSVENYKDFQRRMKLMNKPSGTIPKEKLRLIGPERNEERKKEAPKDKARPQDQERRERKKSPVRTERDQEASPEQIFSLAPGQSFTKEELKKKYHELLKQNHPDKVASLGQAFKTLAEKNTVEINKAYDKLKSKAA